DDPSADLTHDRDVAAICRLDPSPVRIGDPGGHGVLPHCGATDTGIASPHHVKADAIASPRGRKKSHDSLFRDRSILMAIGIFWLLFVIAVLSAVQLSV
ncbi:hypothetical protein B4N84_00455, partial [Flavobacterium sp. IR1]